MRFTNTSPYPDKKVRELLALAFHGVSDAGIEVHVKSRKSGWRGRAYDGIPPVANVAKTSRFLIVIRLAPSNRLPKKASLHKSKMARRLYPNGLPIERWEDALVYVAAHEARHIWQYQRKRRTGRGGKGEHDAIKFGARRLNAWREQTGRDPIKRVKQPNPFAAQAE